MSGIVNTPEDVAEAAAALRSVVAGVDQAPDTAGDPLHLAYLRGAADALAVVAEGDGPDSFEVGRAVRDAGDVASSENVSPETHP